MAGRKPIPTKLKILMGNPGKRKKDIERNEPTPELGIPDMPEWLSAFPVAVSEWKRESEILFGMGVLTLADSSALATRCFLASQIQDAAAEISKIEGEKNYVQIKSLLTEYRQVGASLGLDPSSRSRLTVNPKEKKASKFDGLFQVKK